MRKSIFFGLLSFLVVALLMVPSISFSQPKYGGTLVFAVQSGIHNLDPHKILDIYDGRTCSLICNTLVETGKNYEYQPGLAESWETSEGGKVYTFHLRKGVKWHNGREMTAADIKWNIDRIMDPKTATIIGGSYEVVDLVEVVNDYTIKFTLKKPSGGFLGIFGGTTQISSMIAPECVNEDGSITHPIGTGPFEFVEWKANEYFKVKKFKDYWMEGLPYLDEVIIKTVPDDTTRMTALRTGDVDLADYLPIDQVTKLVNNPPEGLAFSLHPLGGNVFIGFNLSKPPFNDVKVRQAFAYGIDKNELLQGVWEGLGETVSELYSKVMPWHTGVPVTPRDIDKAKALLKQAGYPDGLEVVLSASNTLSYHLSSAQIIQAQLKEIGMNIKLDVSDWPTTIGKWVKGDFIATIADVNVTADPGILYQWMFTPTGKYGFAHGYAYNNPRVIQLIDEAGMMTDFDERKKIYAEINSILSEDLPWVFTTVSRIPYGWRSYVKGFEPHIVGLYCYAGGGLQDAWLDK